MASWQAKGKGKQQSFLQKAIEGAVVNALGLADFGKSDTAGKGADKGKDGDKAQKAKDWRCCWDDCKAAQKQSTMRFGRLSCWACHRPKGTAVAPPLERMVEWAFDAKVAGGPAAKRAGKGKGTGKDSGKTGKKDKDPASAGPAEKEKSEQLAALRLRRLEQLKTGAPVAPPMAATEEVAKVFANGKDPALVKVRLEEQMVEDSTMLATHAKEVVDSMHSEHYPSEKELPTAEDTLSTLLLSVESCASLETKETADKALKATEQAVACLQGVGTSPNDSVLIALLKKKDQQLKDVTRLADKAPSDKLRKQALVEAKGRYMKGLQAEEDFCEKGRLKAVERTRLRSRNLARLTKLIECLETTTTAEAAKLDEQHAARTTLKEQLGLEVQALLDERIQQLDDKMSVEFSDEEFSDVLEPPTETERLLAEAQLKVENAMAMSSAELQRGQQQALTDAAILKAQAERDLALREKSNLEDRVAKMEQLMALQNSAGAPAAAATLVLTAPQDVDAMLADLHREFDAAEGLLPALDGAPTPEQATTLKKLASLFASIPWGAQLPAVSFHLLGAPPHFIHSLVGDAMWKDCWKEKQGVVKDSSMVPTKMLGIVKWVVEARAKQEAYVTDAVAGAEDFRVALEAAQARRVLGSPY